MPRTEALVLLAVLLVQVSARKGGRRLPSQKGTSKDSHGFRPYQNKLFRGPHNRMRLPQELPLWGQLLTKQ